MIDREVKEVKEDVDLEMVSKYKTIQIPRRPLWDSKRTPEEAGPSGAYHLPGVETLCGQVIAVGCCHAQEHRAREGKCGSVREESGGLASVVACCGKERRARADCG